MTSTQARVSSRDLRRRRMACAAAIGAAVAAPLLLIRGPEAKVDDRRPESHPKLFVDSPLCPEETEPARSGARSEEVGRFFAERYPYDPRDGVRAVRAYRVAADCYVRGGRFADADRIGAALSRLLDQVTRDYAAARLTLAQAIEAERWPDVLREARRLHLLTLHVGASEYDEWLRQITGKAMARQHDSR